MCTRIFKSVASSYNGHCPLYSPFISVLLFKIGGFCLVCLCTVQWYSILFVYSCFCTVLVVWYVINTAVLKCITNGMDCSLYIPLAVSENFYCVSYPLSRKIRSSNPFGKGPHPLLWDAPRVALVKIQ